MSKQKSEPVDESGFIDPELVDEAPEQGDPVPGPSTPLTEAGLAQVLQSLVQAMSANQPIRKKTFAEVKPISPFNPTGKRDRKLPCKVFQNYFRVDVTKVHDQVIADLGTLKAVMERVRMPVKYAGGLITCVFKDDGPEVELHFHYNNATSEQKLPLYQHIRSFGDIVSLAIQEAQSQDDEYASRRARAR
jgi:hypothetical protein